MVEKKLEDVPLWFVRVGVIVGLVPGISWVAVSTLIDELKPIPKYVYWACNEFISGMKFMWKHGRLPEDGEW